MTKTTYKLVTQQSIGSTVFNRFEVENASGNTIDAAILSKELIVIWSKKSRNSQLFDTFVDSATGYINIKVCLDHNKITQAEKDSYYSCCMAMDCDFENCHSIARSDSTPSSVDIYFCRNFVRNEI